MKYTKKSGCFAKVSNHSSVWVLFMFFGCMIFANPLFAQEIKGGNMEKVLDQIHWLGQAAVRINMGSASIYVDPYNLTEEKPADMILVTHGHGDHFSVKDILSVSTENTLLFAPADVVDALPKEFPGKAETIAPGWKKEALGISLEAVPAYNVTKTQFHPKKNNWAGYVITIDGVRVYHAGDTERIPEMKEFSCDIALLPLGQTYTMNSVDEAAQAALDVKAKIAVPIHYGMYEGKKEDAKTFQNLLADKVKVVIKEQE